MSDNVGVSISTFIGVQVDPGSNVALVGAATVGAGSGGGGGGGAPTNAQYLVATSDATLSAEIVVGATPGGELGGTWQSPTVDASHSGSTHAAVQAAAEATAAAALAAHASDSSDAHDASAISVLDSEGHWTETEVETVLRDVGRLSGNLKVPLSGAIDRWGGTHIGATNTYTTSGDLSSTRQFASSSGLTRDYITGLIINADWCDLEPDKPNNWDFSVIDDALATAATYGQTETGIGLRIFCGRFMPAWILAANSNELAIAHFYSETVSPQEHYGTSAASGDTTNFGGTFSGTDKYASPDVSDAGNATSGAMPKWWHPRLADHYFRLMSEIANRYESEAVVRQVQMAMVSTYYAEPMLHQRTTDGFSGSYKPNYARIGESTTKTEGWTAELEESAWNRMFEIHKACFPRTRSTLACNPAERYDDDTGNSAYTASIDPHYTAELCARAKAVLGPNLILTNHSIRDPRQGTGSTSYCWRSDHLTVSRYTDMFDNVILTADYPRRGWQTAPMSTLGSGTALKNALADGVTMGGAYAEMPTGYYTYLTRTEWQGYQDDYVANAAAVVAP